MFDEFERRFSEFVVEQNIIKVQIRDDRLVVEEKLKLMSKREDNMDRTLEIYVSCVYLTQGPIELATVRLPRGCQPFPS